MLFKRGNVWWYKIKFNGAEIRDSANTDSKTMADAAEKARRRKLCTPVEPTSPTATRVGSPSPAGSTVRSL